VGAITITTITVPGLLVAPQKARTTEQNLLDIMYTTRPRLRLDLANVMERRIITITTMVQVQLQLQGRRRRQRHPSSFQ
jgi:hypothetical protein